MPVIASEMPDLSVIASQLNYDHETGLFTWKINKKGPAKAGHRAGAVHSRGYITIRINGHDYLAHRLAWFIQYGTLNEYDQIDHINLDRKDNRIVNLRKATHAENCRNTKVRSHSFSKLKGAHYHKVRKKYRARITIDKKQIWLGYFNTAEEAHAAYKEASLKLHGNFSSS
jgi:hypothetical protein